MGLSEQRRARRRDGVPDAPIASPPLRGVRLEGHSPRDRPSPARKPLCSTEARDGPFGLDPDGAGMFSPRPAARRPRTRPRRSIRSRLPAPPAAPASGEANSGLKVPPVFSKKKPETLADLREMEAHLKAVAAKVGPTVVGLQIGRAQGSGVIVTGDGYVLTAGHVSEALRTAGLRVILPSGQVVEGRTLGRVRGSDAGLIKIQGSCSDWPHTAMAAEGSIEEGEWCLTLGHPGGFNKERAAPLRFGQVLGTSPNTIQTDCELVGGDSGGRCSTWTAT